jgi:hypothetical protein
MTAWLAGVRLPLFGLHLAGGWGRLAKRVRRPPTTEAGARAACPLRQRVQARFIAAFNSE